MRAMKDSGIEWIGDIPARWSVVPNYAVFTQHRALVGDQSRSYTLLSLTKRGIIVRDIEAGGKFPSSFDSYQVVHPGQMVFCLFDIDETPRTVGLSTKEGMITGAYDVFDINETTCNPRYVLYYYIAVDDGKHLRLYYKSLRKTLTTSAFMHVKMLVPPIDEQNRISAYLDERCAKIDDDIARRRAIIEKLNEYKKSLVTRTVTRGLDADAEIKPVKLGWATEIPASWGIAPLWSLYRQKKEPHHNNEQLLSVYLNRGVIRYVDSTGMQVHKPSESLDDYQLVEPTDLVLNNQQAWRGSLGVSEYRGIVSPAYFVLAQISNLIIPSYINYLLRNAAVPMFELCSKGVGTIQRNLDIRKTLHESIPLPSIEEQRGIVAFLDERCTKIDELIAKQTEIIEKLGEYKKSLVTHAVTGKIDCREAQR